MNENLQNILEVLFVFISDYNNDFYKISLSQIYDYNIYFYYINLENPFSYSC